MEMLQHLGDGFEAAFTLTNMMFICAGVTLGIIFGVTPWFDFDEKAMINGVKVFLSCTLDFLNN